MFNTRKIIIMMRKHKKKIVAFFFLQKIKFEEIRKNYSYIIIYRLLYITIIYEQFFFHFLKFDFL